MGEERMKSGKQPPNPAHVKGVPKGEERVQKKGREPGRQGSKAEASERRSGERSSRVTPVRAIDPDSPTLQTP